MPETKRPLKAFLCHASLDKPKVRELYRYLRRRGIKPWFDEVDLVGGQDWQIEIPKALSTSDAIIICLTKNSVDKEGYIQKEIKFALDKALEMPEGRIFLIPVRFEECEVPFSLSRYQWVDLFDEVGYSRMMRALKFRAAQLERATVQLPKKDIEEESLALEKARREKEEHETAEMTIQETAEHEATEKAEREKAEKIAQGKVKGQYVDIVKPNHLASSVARKNTSPELLSKFWGTRKHSHPRINSLYKVLGVFGFVVTLLWGGLFLAPKLFPGVSAIETVTSQIIATVGLTNTVIPPTQVLNPTAIMTKTITPSPTVFPTVQPVPLGGGVLVFAKGVFGKQDLYAIQGDGLGLTRITSESGYIGYKWSGCDCSGTKSISGYNYVMDLSPSQQFLYYYYAPLGERKLRVVNMLTLKTVVDVRAPYGSSLAWSRHGTKTAYTEFVGEGVESINVVDSDGQNPVKVEQGQQIDNIGWGMDDHILFYTESVCHNQKVRINWGNWEYLSPAPFCDTSIRIADTNLQGDKVIHSLLLLQNGIKLNTSAVASSVSPKIAIPMSKSVVVYDYETRKEVESISYPVKLQGYNIPKTPFWGSDGELLFGIDNPYTKQEEVYEAIDGEFVIVTDQARLKNYDIITPSYWGNWPLRYIGKDARNQDLYVQDIDILNPPEVHGHVISIRKIDQQLNLSEFEYSESAWSPDRNEVALILSRDETHSVLIVYSLQDQQFWKVVGEVADYSNVAWSPDGKYLGFILQSSESTAALYVVGREGADMKKLSDTSNKDLAGLFWTPFANFLKP